MQWLKPVKMLGGKRTIGGYILGLLMIVLLNSSVLAAPDVFMDYLTVDIKPEYDSSDVFVVYDGMLKNTGAENWQGDVIFRIPTDARVEYACELENGEHICQLYTVEDKGEYKELRWTASKPVGPNSSLHVYLELYYDGVVGSAEKAVDFVYNNPYLVKDLSVQVTQPARSTDFTLNPAPSKMYNTAEGLKVHQYRYSDFDQDRMSYSISYTKADSNPSVAKQAAQQGPTTGTPLGEESAIVLLLGVVVLAVAFFVLGAKGSRRRSKSAKGHKGKSGSEDERKKARQMLLDGKITEKTYHKILDEIRRNK